MVGRWRWGVLVVEVGRGAWIRAWRVWVSRGMIKVISGIGFMVLPDMWALGGGQGREGASSER